MIPGNFPALLLIVGILNSYAVSYADAIAITMQQAFLGASRLQDYIPCPACSEILARTRNGIESIVPHRLSVRKAIGQSDFRARALIFEFLLRNYKYILTPYRLIARRRPKPKEREFTPYT